MAHPSFAMRVRGAPVVAPSEEGYTRTVSYLVARLRA
jgi:hypothetical protein